MRIGIDARMYSTEFTGIGRYVYELVKQLTQIDDKNEYVLFMNEPEYSRFVESKRVKKVLVKAKHYSVREQLGYLWKLHRAKLDLMHFTHFNAPILYRKPSVVTIHDLTLSFFPALPQLPLPVGGGRSRCQVGAHSHPAALYSAPQCPCDGSLP